MKVFLAVLVSLSLLATGSAFAADQAELVKKIEDMSRQLEELKQQMQDMQARYRVVSVTYPAVNTLEKLSEGVLAVMDAEKSSVRISSAPPWGDTWRNTWSGNIPKWR